MPTRTAYTLKPRKCLDCPTVYQPRGGRSRRCPPCQKSHARRHHNEWQRQQRCAANGRPLERAEPRYLYRTDFLLALPQMRAELARAVSGEKSIHVERTDPTEIPNHRGRGYRNPTGRPKDAA